MSKLDRNQEKVRKLSLLPENKECMDCQMRGTPYVVMDYCTFVCSFCSGLHRHFQHRVKGISMTNFKDEEVEKLKNGGNKKASEIWRATWNPKEHPKPKSSNDPEIRKFIKDTYEKKIWYSTSGKKESSNEDLPDPIPINEVIKEPIKIKIDREGGNNNNNPPQKAETTQGFGDDDDWDAKFDETPKQENGVGLFFESPPQNQSQQSKQKNTINVDDLFGPSVSNQQFAPQGYGAPDPNLYQGNPMAYGGAPTYGGYGGYGYPQQQNFAPQNYGPQAFSNQGFPQQGMQQNIQHGYNQQGFGAYGYQQPYGQSSYGQQQMYNPQGDFGNTSNPFGGINPFDSSPQVSQTPQPQQFTQDTQMKPASSKPDPFASLAGLGKASLKQPSATNGNLSTSSQKQNTSSNGFDDFPF